MPPAASFVHLPSRDWALSAPLLPGGTRSDGTQLQLLSQHTLTQALAILFPAFAGCCRPHGKAERDHGRWVGGCRGRIWIRSAAGVAVSSASEFLPPPVKVLSFSWGISIICNPLETNPLFLPCFPFLNHCGGCPNAWGEDQSPVALPSRCLLQWLCLPDAFSTPAQDFHPIPSMQLPAFTPMLLISWSNGISISLRRGLHNKKKFLGLSMPSTSSPTAKPVPDPTQNRNQG